MQSAAATGGSANEWRPLHSNSLDPRGHGCGRNRARHLPGARARVKPAALSSIDQGGGERRGESSPKHLFSRNLVVRRYLTIRPTNCLGTPASALCPLFPISDDFVVVSDQNVARSHTSWQRWIGRGAFVLRRTLSQLPHPLKVC